MERIPNLESRQSGCGFPENKKFYKFEISIMRLLHCNRNIRDNISQSSAPGAGQMTVPNVGLGFFSFVGCGHHLDVLDRARHLPSAAQSLGVAIPGPGEGDAC